MISSNPTAGRNAGMDSCLPAVSSNHWVTFYLSWVKLLLPWTVLFWTNMMHPLFFFRLAEFSPVVLLP
jgi:hypothetical protein